MTAPAPASAGTVACRETHPGKDHLPTSAHPRVALIMLVATPYWLNLHRRIDREIPEIELHCLYTHDIPDQPWSLDGAEDIRPVSFGKGERAEAKTIFSSAPRELARARRIIRWLKENDARFVVLYGYNDAGRVRIVHWCRRAGIPCFISSDNNIKQDRLTGFKRILKRVLCGSVVRAAAGAMPFGTAGRNYFVRYGMRPDRIFCVPGEPDYSIIDNVTPDDVASVRDRFGLRDGRRRLVFCGRLVAVKGVDTLLDAFCRIAPTRPEWDLVIVGSGALREQLEKSVPVELKHRIVWTGFIGDPAEIAGVYKACDALVLPSRVEPWGLVVNEAAAAGLAIVASDVVGASDDLLRVGVNGFEFRAADAEDLARALLSTTDPEKIDTYRAASPRVLADYRDRCDPVKGLRAALQATGILTPPR